MKCSCGQNISTPDFMKALDLSQLRRAVEIAQGHIDQKTAETKVMIYRVVDDSGYCHSNHLTFEGAAAGFADAAKEMITAGDIPREMSIVRERHIESEVTQYCPEYRAAAPAKEGGEG